MQLNYNHLYYFHVAAFEGTVAAAAARLGVTQPTVSEQLRALERALGSELFERTQTGLKLTESGRLTFEVTSQMFRFGEKLVELLGHRGAEAPRLLRIGVSGGIARSITTDFVFPLLSIDECMPSVRTGEIVELLRELRGGALDLVLSESEPPEATRRGLSSVLIEQTRLVVIAPPDLDPAPDWSNVLLLQYRPRSSFRLEVDTFLERRSLKPKVAAEADDALVLLEIAMRGNYVAIVPRAIVRDAVARGRLKILEELTPSSVAVHALYQDSVATDLARRAIDVLVEHVRAASEP
jgi:LysR family transcriptional regulator, transcriptional activator of nhaA